MSNLFKDEKRFELDLELNVKKKMAKNVIQKLTNLSSIHSMRELNLFGS